MNVVRKCKSFLVAITLAAVVVVADAGGGSGLPSPASLILPHKGGLVRAHLQTNVKLGQVFYFPDLFSTMWGRNLLQIDTNVLEPMRPSDGTVRVDPLDHLKKYGGGFDLTNKHYLSSLVFSGIYGYAIGVVWLLCGILFGGFLVATSFSCLRKKRSNLKKRLPCNRECSLWAFIITACFTIFAIATTGLVLGENAKFHSRATTVINIIIETANNVSTTIYNTTGAMRTVDRSFEESSILTQASSFLDSTSHQLDDTAAMILQEAKKNRRLIIKGLKILSLVTIIAISLNLIVALALSVFGFLKLNSLLNKLIGLCWFLTFFCWLLFGIYIVLHEFADDACTALESFQQNPFNNSLNTIIPCNQILSAESALDDVSEGIYNLVNQVNANITNLQQDASLPTLIQICNPFSAPPDYSYLPENCPENTIKIGEIPKALGLITCADVGDASCGDQELIPLADLKLVEVYTNSIQTLLNAYPGIKSLVECQVVKDGFAKITSKHCRPLKRYARILWSALVTLSTIMVILILTWVSKSCQESNQSAESSVAPSHKNSSILQSRQSNAFDIEA